MKGLCLTTFQPYVWFVGYSEVGKYAKSDLLSK